MANYTKREERRRELLHTPPEPQPPRRDKARPGPVPTIGEAAKDDTPWFWAHCPIPCGHAGALPWAPVIARLGPHADTHHLRAALRCTVCGHKGGTIRLVGRSRYELPPQSIPVAQMPAWVAREYLRKIGVE